MECKRALLFVSISTLLLLTNSFDIESESKVEYDDPSESINSNVLSGEETSTLPQTDRPASDTQQLATDSSSSEATDPSTELTTSTTLSNDNTESKSDAKFTTSPSTSNSNTETTLKSKESKTLKDDSVINVASDQAGLNGTNGNESEYICPSGDSLKDKIDEIIKHNIPNKVELGKMTLGHRIPLTLENGHLNLGTIIVSGNPSCVHSADENLYTLMVQFKDIRGAFDWKLYNLFGKNYSESVLLTLDKLKAEFTFSEKKSIVGPRVTLKRLNLSPLENLGVKVNIPEKVMEIKDQDVNYITSRMTTFVVNRSKALISKHFKDSFMDAVKNKSSIHP